MSRQPSNTKSSGLGLGRLVLLLAGVCVPLGVRAHLQVERARRFAVELERPASERIGEALLEEIVRRLAGVDQLRLSPDRRAATLDLSGGGSARLYLKVMGQLAAGARPTDLDGGGEVRRTFELCELRWAGHTDRGQPFDARVSSTSLALSPDDRPFEWDAITRQLSLRLGIVAGPELELGTADRIAPFFGSATLPRP